MFIRAELHNHTIHSDGALTPEQLSQYAQDHEFQVIALTDHNTASGQEEMQAMISQHNMDLSLIKGIEMTTYYGHVLGLGMTRMIDFSDLDPRHPEPFFVSMRKNGARAIGLAHPFCIGKPIMVGCRFEMEVHDWSLIDYIEIYNTSAQSNDSSVSDECFFTGNGQAVDFWKDKVLQGYRLAAVTGKDIHKAPEDNDVFITFCEVDEKDMRPNSEKALSSILTQRTMVTKGPLIELKQDQDKVTIHFEPSGYHAWKSLPEGSFILKMTSDNGNIIEQMVNLHQDYTVLIENAHVTIFELFDGNDRIAIARPLYWRT